MAVSALELRPRGAVALMDAALRLCVLEAGGNAQAYALGSLLVLLELDMGWEIVDGDVVEKVGEPREGRVRTVVCWESR